MFVHDAVAAMFTRQLELMQEHCDYYNIGPPKLLMVTVLQGAPKNNNPLGKIRCLWNCSKFCHEIYSVYRGGFRPYILQISLQYFVAFRNYNSLNLNVHF